MNRDKQIEKDLQNKKLQARDEYAKNKTLLKETLVNEKSNNYIPHNEMKDQAEEIIKNSGKKKGLESGNQATKE